MRLAMTSATLPEAEQAVDGAATTKAAATGERPYVVFGYGSLIFKVKLPQEF